MQDFAHLFHESSKRLSTEEGARIPRDMKEWPDEWKTISYKSYGSLPQILLPHSAPPGGVGAAVEKRVSTRVSSGAALSRETLGVFLGYSCGARGEGRAQPSGGHRYPIEVYPIVLRGSAGVSAGVYHYAVREHALDVLWRRPFSDTDVDALFSYEWVRSASVVFVMTAVFGRNRMKYGDRGYRYALLEAGHIGQNMYLNASSLGLSCCALGATRDREIERLIDVDGNTESVVYALVVGSSPRERQ
jgi:SagB-type dehydrogenase family enzyme